MGIQRLYALTLVSIDKNMLRDIFYSYAPNFLSTLYFRLGINLVPESSYPVDIGGVKKVCIFAMSELDGLATFEPMIESLRVGIPDIQIILVVSSDVVKDVLEGDDLADEVIVLDGKRKFRQIREDWPDLTIAASGSGFTHAKMAFRTGAMYKLGFRYDHEDKQDIGFLFTHAVPLDESKSTEEQKLDIIRSLGLAPIG